MMNNDTSPLDPPGSLDGADSGLPPTPPTMLQDGQPAAASDLLSKKSSLSTPVNARSPPTPDPSPPRTTGSNATHDRPSIFTYPSSRAESFRTAREDPLSSEPSHSRSTTPIGDRLSTVDEDRGLGLAFEREDNDITPTHLSQPASSVAEVSRHTDTTAGAQEDKEHESQIQDEIPDREWDTNLMRNVTVRRKRKLKSSPQKEHSLPAVDIVETASPSPSPRPRRTSALRERVQASNNSPVTPSIEHFAQSIGWPTDGKITPEEKDRVASDKRHSTSSMGSTMVEAKIIVTPPRRRQTLRHSGKNMAYHRDEGSPTPDRGSRMSNRTSLQSEDVPLHRLVHKRVSVADRSGRISAAESDTFGTERNFSTPVSLRSMRQRTIDSSAATLRHQESVRNVLQPAADILCRSNTRYWDNSPNRRFFSAPESRRSGTQYRSSNVSYPPPIVEQASPPMQSPTPILGSPRSMKKRQPVAVKHPADFNKSLPDLPQASDTAPQDVEQAEPAAEDKKPPEALMERVRMLVAEREAREGEVCDEKEVEDGGAEVESSPQIPSSPAMPTLESVTTSPGAPTSPRIPSSPPAPTSPPQASTLSPSLDSSPPIYRGTNSSRGRSGERRRSSLSQDRASLSPETMLRPSLDRVSTDETPRRSYEWRRPYEEHGRVSFDRSTIRTEEHAMARHLYATTPFSQFSDTPIEVSEATAVSIYPHNNHSLLVVQQVSRANSMLPEPRRLDDGMHLVPHDEREIRSTPTPPFVDARESTENNEEPPQPTLNFEPSTPPMQIALPQPSAVDSPLKNPRPPPEPPKIMFIPPTPAEELEKQLVPGPPKRSDSHPQRRLSIVQKARRYSDNLLPTLLGRSSSRGRYVPSSHARRTQDKTRVPTVNDEDGALHPFWRPRGFWDGFDESESESDEEVLPEGGDTSDIEPEPATTPKRSNTLGKKLTNGLRGSGGFLIGNSLGVERHGSNSRRHRVVLPSQLLSSSKSAPSSTVDEPPKLLIHPPTGDISRRSSRSSLRSSSDRGRRSWRQGRKIPGLKGYHVQYIGLSGVKERFRERGKEKRRDRIRKSIGSRYYVE